MSLDKALKQTKAPAVRKAIINSMIQNIFLKNKPQIKKFEEEFGRTPPGFLLISPGKFCNLKCIGCYANSSSASSEKLDWDIVDRIITEKNQSLGFLFHSYFRGRTITLGKSRKNNS